MKAFLRTTYGGPDVLELRDVPTPVPGDGEALVRVAATSINMADVDYLLGRPKMARLSSGLRNPRSQRLGLDVAGVVEAVGPNVSRFAIGDAVIGDLTNHGMGAFAEYACAPVTAFAPKPRNLSFTEAAAVPQAGIMATQGLQGRRPVRTGQRVLINGAGGTVGPFAIQIAKALGADVTGVDHTDKLDLMKTVGADRTIDYTNQDFTKTGERYNRILDIAAFHSILASRRTLAPGGVYVMIPGTMAHMVRLLATPFLSLVGSRRMGLLPWHPMAPADMATLTGLIESGDVKPYLDRTFSFEQIPEALAYQMEGHARGKLVVEIRT